MLVSPPPAASVLSHHPRWRREGGVQPGSSSLGHSREVLTTSLRPQRSATRRVFLSPLALRPGSQQLDTNKLFWWLFLVPLCLLLAARHPRWSAGLTCGEDTACHCLLSVQGGCLAAAGDHTLAVEAQAPRGPGRPGITYELLSSEDRVLGHWSCV